MASTAFRDSMSSLGWSRRDPDVPANTNPTSSTPFLSTLQSINPFADRGGYVSLPTSNEGPGAPLPAPTRREEEEGFFARESPCSLFPRRSRLSVMVASVPACPLLSHAYRHAAFRPSSVPLLCLAHCFEYAIMLRSTEPTYPYPLA